MGAMQPAAPSSTSAPRVGILYTMDHIPAISYNPGDDMVRDGQRYLLS